MVDDWCCKFYSDKVKVEIRVGGGYNCIWQKLRTEMQDCYLRPTFKGERVLAMFWAAIDHGCQSLLIYIHQQPPAEYCWAND
jgi:hypothetical protein